ncbi:iron chelate uptake ABC transporter family permease subunit [Vibrio sinaloensis]|nr:iron chelate uptake ABC transporter family permease subunit [Vibrio sinaloensis]
MEFSQLLYRKQRRWHLFAVFITVTLAVLSAIYLMVGELFISPFSPLSPLMEQLVTQLRLPRLLTAITIGAALAVSGAVLQVLLGNVLAEPGVIGISGGASVMMVLVLFFYTCTSNTHWLYGGSGIWCFGVYLVTGFVCSNGEVDDHSVTLGGCRFGYFKWSCGDLGVFISVMI